MRKEVIMLSKKALEILMWMFDLWQDGKMSGPAFDLDTSIANSYETHPDVIALYELEKAGLVTLIEDEVMKLSWTLSADLTDSGRERAMNLVSTRSHLP
ncbi:MAG: hypothetical protein HC933_04950 [Pleurocapsa sp. SU_196_0]|nr:hypothetical protein [Pleurocapsa sp. SU_196_0]